MIWVIVDKLQYWCVVTGTLFGKHWEVIQSEFLSQEHELGCCNSASQVETSLRRENLLAVHHR